MSASQEHQNSFKLFMLRTSFETAAESYMWTECVRWIKRLALADCEQCMRAEPFSLKTNVQA